MSSRKVRVKKLSIKTTLPVLREDQIDPSEYEALTTDSLIATGVEQAEENEYHLQTILKEAGTSNDQEIPVPPPQESSISYDELYPSSFNQPFSYIRFSQTVEECISCLYDMNTEDHVFLKTYNAGVSPDGPLSDDEFERIMYVFEDTAAEQTPYASVDNTVIAYDMMLSDLSPLGPQILLHAKAVFEYWKTRRQVTSNRPLHPTLKFETHQETDDVDPYVCFRRREARQTRKTRARDNKVAEALKRLRREVDDGRQLVLLSSEREVMKHDLLLAEQSLFEERAKLKQIKVALGIRTGEEDLFNQRPQKRKAVEPLPQRGSGTQFRPPVRSEGRSVEPDLVLLSDIIAQREKELREDIEVKMQHHRRWNQNYIDLTRDAMSPVRDHGTELRFRPAKTEYLMTPPASITSDSMDIDDEGAETMVVDRQEAAAFQFKTENIGNEQMSPRQPCFRRRIGRLQRLWIDRRGMSSPSREVMETSDRWKYDSEGDDEEPTVYDMDPYDVRAIKFRATIPLGQYMYRGGRQPVPPDGAGVGSVGNRMLPALQAAAASAAQAQAQAQTHAQGQLSTKVQAQHASAA
ncbi:hypothetical protein CDD81_7358 [Ophiocordyceps australis]|uniref:Enhancer of polycomb-like protein n=1 Tax=Ophiocordyceps australis TaxID=1399860 RepID=A0A2C5Y5C3_9HYPO|nr:hypothetical protein CDD81_7358 [Ophiocordyceps australis]